MPFLQHNNRHDCWIFQSADVWTVHSSASLETFNNPYARLGVARDETRRVSCFARKRTERENDIVSLKYSSLRFFWINLFTRLFAFFPSPPFFCFFLLTISHLGFALSVCPHWQHQNTVKGSVWKGVREHERQWGKSRSWDALWVTRLNEALCMVHAPLQRSTLQSLFCTCTVNIWERRGARVEQPLSSAGSLPAASLVDVPFKFPARVPNCLCACCITSLFTFPPILVHFILLTSHFLLASSAFSFSSSFLFFVVFFTLTSSCLHWFWRLCGCFCVCAIRWGEWGAKGVTSGGPVTCELELNLWCMSPHFSRLAALHSENSCFDWNVVVGTISFCWSPSQLFMRNKTLLSTDNQTFLCLHSLTNRNCLDRNVNARN